MSDSTRGTAYACKKCGADEFIEETIIVLAGGPSADPRYRSTPRSSRYRLKCVKCGHVDGNKFVPLAKSRKDK